MLRPLTAQAVIDEHVYLFSATQLGDPDDLPAAAAGALVNDRRITALAPHPQLDDLVYVTTGHPEALGFLPDDYVEIEA